MQAYEKRKEFLAVFFNGENFDEIQVEFETLGIDADYNEATKCVSINFYWPTENHEFSPAGTWFVYSVRKKKWKTYTNRDFQKKFKPT